MRTNIGYVHRCRPREAVGVPQVRSPTRQGSGRDGNDGQNTESCGNNSDTHIQEPPAKIPRKEQNGDEVLGSPDGRLQIAPISATRSILQGVLNFFRRKEPSPAVPTPSVSRLSLPLSLSGLFFGRRREEQQEQQQKQLPITEDASENKENIPPVPQEQASAKAALHAFRQEGSSKKRPRQESNTLPAATQQPSRHEPLVELPRAITTASGRQDEATTRKAKDTGTKVPKKPPAAALRRSKAEDGVGPIQVSYRQFVWFTLLAECPKILKFLKRDICYRFADKYLLAMVFTYFVRARLTREQYNVEYFYAALYLAHDMEEDEEELKYEVLPWALGPRWKKSYPSLIKIRDDIFWAIHCRAVVSKRGCDQVMNIQPDCWMWQRERPGYHGGAMREYLRDPSDNGRPRGPDKSPLQCQLCLEREIANSDNSYLLYLSDSTSSISTVCLDTTTKENREGDSGFETFLFERCDASLLASHDSKHRKTSPELDVV